MGLFQKAVETYDNMEHLTGMESEAMKAALAPIGFITTGVQIAITVTENGEFVKFATNSCICVPKTKRAMMHILSSCRIGVLPNLPALR